MLVKEKRRFLSRIVLVILGIVLLLGSMCFVCGNAEAKNIVKGDTTENIKIVQQRLYNLKYYTYKVDGIWGSRTLAAVKNFQRDKGLVADGIVGAKTEKALGVTLSQSGSTSLSSTELNLLARCVYSEARGEPYTGQVAVAAVVLNRVRSSSFPNTVSGVIYQPGAFTAVSDGQINLTPNETAYKAARDALNGWDPTYGCIYYYNPQTATNQWIRSRPIVVTIGKHVFCT